MICLNDRSHKQETFIVNDAVVLENKNTRAVTMPPLVVFTGAYYATVTLMLGSE